VLKGTRLTTIQPTSSLSQDLLQVVLYGPDFPATTIWNVYNAPSGSEDAGQGLSFLLQQSPPPNTTIAGDFNLRHRD